MSNVVDDAMTRGLGTFRRTAETEPPERAFLAGLSAFTQHLTDHGYTIVAGPSAVEFVDVEAAAMWLGEKSRHPRYSGIGWGAMVEHPYEIEFAVAAALRQPTLTPADRVAVARAEAVIRAHHTAHGAPSPDQP